MLRENDAAERYHVTERRIDVAARRTGGDDHGMEDEQAERECGEQRVERIASHQRLDGQALHQVAGGDHDEDGQRSGREIGQTQHSHAVIERVAGDHEEFAMGEIDDAHDAEDRRQPASDKRVADADGKAVHQLLHKDVECQEYRLPR